MSQFTSLRGVNPEIAESTVLLDTREAVLRTDREDGVFESEVVGDVVTVVTPVGNVTTASIYVNDRAVANGHPVEGIAEKAAQVVSLVEAGTDVEEIELRINRPELFEEEDTTEE